MLNVDTNGFDELRSKRKKKEKMEQSFPSNPDIQVAKLNIGGLLFVGVGCVTKLLLVTESFHEMEEKTHFHSHHIHSQSLKVGTRI